VFVKSLNDNWQCQFFKNKKLWSTLYCPQKMFFFFPKEKSFNSHVKHQTKDNRVTKCVFLTSLMVLNNLPRVRKQYENIYLLNSKNLRGKFNLEKKTLEHTPKKGFADQFFSF
jgi:hypothetical protein